MVATRIGVSLSHRLAARLGLEPAAALERLGGLGLAPLRLSAYWDEVAAGGYATLDRLIDTAEAGGLEVVLTLGLKAMRWPEFYTPTGLRSADLHHRLLEFVGDTVERYRDRAAVTAWQVENEPFNRSGPERRLVPEAIVATELVLVRQLDSRPIVLTCFRNFNPLADLAARPSPFGQAEAAVMAMLGPGDVLGLDVHPIVERRLGRLKWTSRARPGWPEAASGLREAAERRGLRAWVTEAQAEPWGNAAVTPADVADLTAGLRRAGFDTILLWGAEHWLARHRDGDPSWVRMVERLASAGGSAGSS